MMIWGPMICSVSLRLYTFSLIIIIAACYFPENPISCTRLRNFDCKITNSYAMFLDRSTSCEAFKVVYPETEEELKAIISSNTALGRKMKVATQYSHSIPKLVCPGGKHGVLISTKKLIRILNVDTELLTMTVESGVTLRRLISVAARNGMALPYTPYWWGLTIGGILGTGAHGSTLNSNGSSVHDHVKELTIISPGRAIDNGVRVSILGENNEELKAAKTSLGVLGVIYKVSLKLEPLFKRSITFSTKSDSDLAVRAPTFGYEHEFADITWYPSQQKVIYRKDHRVPSDTHGDGLNNYILFRATNALTETTLLTTKEDQELNQDVNGKCLAALKSTTNLHDEAFGFTNTETHFTGYPVIGYHNHLQASGACLDASGTDGCAWDHRLGGRLFFQTAFSIKLSVVASFIRDVQELVRLNPKALCSVDLNNGILMRYVTKSSSYLGQQENAISFDFTYYRRKEPSRPRLYEDVIEEIEQMAIFKYRALPHWGKNRNVAFMRVINKYKRDEDFLRVKRLFDEFGLFSSEWTNQILGLEDGLTIYEKGCALEGLCICNDDIHCDPDNGYLCREGKIYKEAWVCRYIP